MRTGYRALVVAMLIAAAPAVEASGHWEQAGWHVHQPVRYMVSGVLRKNGTTDTIKPIQAVIVADTGDTAVQQFAKVAQHDYPGYALIATLASPVPDAARCENSI